MMTTRVLLAAAILALVASAPTTETLEESVLESRHEADLESEVTTCTAGVTPEDCICVCIRDDCKCECPVPEKDDMIDGEAINQSIECMKGGSGVIGERMKRATCLVYYRIYVHRITRRYFIVYYVKCY